jgi:hypothetical protein
MIAEYEEVLAVELVVTTERQHTTPWQCMRKHWQHWTVDPNGLFVGAGSCSPRETPRRGGRQQPHQNHARPVNHPLQAYYNLDADETQLSQL